MIAVDTNVLVYAHREELPEHERALRWLRHLAGGPTSWALPSFCLGEFVRVVTHPRIFDPPSSLDQAVGALEGLMVAPSARVLGAGARYPGHLFDALRTGRATANVAFDAQIAAVCRQHGVGRLVTRDRDFSRFSWIQMVDLDEEPSAFV